MNLPYQPWHYQPTLLQRMALTTLGRLHDWVSALPFVQMEPLRSWSFLCLEPTYSLTEGLESEYERLYESINLRCIRTAARGETHKHEQACASRKVIVKRLKYYRVMKSHLEQASIQSNYWRDCAQRFRIPIDKPREQTWSILGLMLPAENPSVVDTFGRTALHNATFWGSPEKCSALLRAGADATKPDHHGNTPLHYLCMRYRTKSAASQVEPQEIFGLLVHYGADPEAANIDGRTPRQISPNAPFFQHMRQRERLSRLARKSRRQSEAPARRAL